MKNIMKATLSDSVDAKHKWVKNIIDKNISEEYENAVRSLDASNPIERSLLAKMYGYGYGVEKDIDKAILLMNISVEEGIGWARNELIDLLILRNKGDDARRAFVICRDSAFEDNVLAKKRLAYMYRDGIGVEKNIDKAIEWMRKAADVSSNITRGDFYNILWKINTPESSDELISIIMPLAESKDGRAMNQLARAYRDGKGVEKDLNKAAEWMRKSVEAGISWAPNELSEILSQINTSESLDEMVKVLIPLAESGNGRAMKQLAQAYRYGKGVEKDFNKAAEWMRKSAQTGDEQASAELFGIIQEMDDLESLGDTAESILPYAELGNIKAMEYLAGIYLNGNNAEKDIHKAAEWMRKAMDAGSEKARGELYNILWKINTPESLSELMKLIVPFAEAGDGRAMNQLARAYRDGKGVEKDLNKAAEWMRKAVHTGIKWAPNELSEILWQINTPDALNEMVVLIMPMAESGDGRAMNQLARAYRDGKGVVKDLDKATKWMRKAADAGIGRAKLELLELL